MFIFPFIHDFLLLNHNLIGRFLSLPIFLLSFQQLILKLRDLNIAIIIKLINSVMIYDFEPIQLWNSSIFFISNSVN